MNKYCTATNVNQPNFSGKARGRAIHLTSDRPKLTKCNMRVVQIFDWEYLNRTTYRDRRCKVCFAPQPVTAKASYDEPDGEEKTTLFIIFREVLNRNSVSLEIQKQLWEEFENELSTIKK